MKRKIFYLLSVIIISVLFISCSKDSNPVIITTEKRFSTEIEAKLEAVLDKVILENQIPGVIVGIWIPNEGNWVKAKGTANLTTNEPMKADNHFRMGSVTKTFTGTIVLKLVDSGKISLDSSLAYYLPQYPFPQANKITVRMLGKMMSGIYSYSADANFVQSVQSSNFELVFTPDSLVKISLQHPLTFNPGTVFDYCNTNTILLSLICEKVTNKSFDVLLQEMIFTPYGLTNTFWPKSRFIPEPFSHGYTNQTSTGAMADATYFNPSWGHAAGMLISNIYDLKTWAKLLRSGSMYSSAMHTERTTWTPESGNRYGFALYDIVGGWIGHNGSIPGFTTSCFYLPSKDGVIIVHVNSDMSSGSTPSDLVFLNLAQILMTSSLPKTNIQTLDQNFSPIKNK